MKGERTCSEAFIFRLRGMPSMFALLGLGGGVGFLSGMFGVGGGFLMTPLLIMIGIPPVVAAASDSNQIVAATTSGTYAHYRMGNVDVKLAVFLLIGGVVGGTLGVQVIKILRQLGEADLIIRIAYVVMLGIMGSYMLFESAQSLRRASVKDLADGGTVTTSRFERLAASLPFQMRFEKSGVIHSPILPLALGGFVGLLAAIMGLGGGFIMVPLLLYVLRVPMQVVVGTNLFQEVFMCANVTFMQAMTNHTVDLVLALVLLAGSAIGAQFGAHFSRRFKADQLKILLACIILLVMGKMLLTLFLPPHLLLDLKGIR
jgi:uncharacterized membrane protein YfcA